MPKKFYYEEEERVGEQTMPVSFRMRVDKMLDQQKSWTDGRVMVLSPPANMCFYNSVAELAKRGADPEGYLNSFYAAQCVAEERPDDHDIGHSLACVQFVCQNLGLKYFKLEDFLKDLKALNSTQNASYSDILPAIINVAD